MGMKGGLGFSGRTRGERHQGNVGCSGWAGLKLATLTGAQHAHVVGAVWRIEHDDTHPVRARGNGQVKLAVQLGVAKGQGRLRFVQNVAQLLGPKQRHGGHGHQTCLDHRQPAQGHAD